ncbi:MAG: alpha/beta hydrolase, partial [Candidatus Sumerlaeota bacterium]|nr:alpha/beta hydrolase [Candidatus Sumerlaeota bacterium]
NGDTMDSGKGTEKLEMGMELAQCGYVFLSIGYRGENKALPNPKDICCEDVISAIRWIRSHAGEYGADPERIALMGGSAGAMSVLEIAYNRKSKYYDPAICAVLDSCGATKAENIQAGAPPMFDCPPHSHTSPTSTSRTVIV